MCTSHCGVQKMSERKAEMIERLLQADDLRHLVPHKRISLPPGTAPANLTLPMAERLLALPLSLGVHTGHGREITLHLGRFGPYVTMHAAEALPDWHSSGSSNALATKIE